MKKKITVFLSLILLFVSSAFIADDPFAALLKQLEEFTKKYPTENVHLHLDKPYYAIGDDIWFKAYVTDSRTATPTQLSTVLYVDLIDENDSLKNQLLLTLKNGIAWGDFKLPDTLSEGNYRIRAYTHLMKNAGPDFFFDKTIKIGNSWANKVFAKVDYTYRTESGSEKINSTIRFTEKNEKPYVLTEVNYIVDLDSKIVARGKLLTNNNGEINIPIVNAMPNASQTGKIVATLTLSNKQKITKVIPIKTTSTAADVQFFPESGSLVQSLPNKIAFKVVNPNGMGEEAKGIILDNEGTEVTNFETSYLGMGNFSLNPQPGKTYKAKVIFKNGNEKIINLPKVETSGYVLSVNNTDTAKIAVKVLLSDDLVGKGNLQLLAQQNGKIAFSVKISTAKNFAVANLPKSEFLSGISVLTLFNGDAAPVAERLIFVNNTFDKINVDVNNLKAQYDKRSPVVLDLTASNQGSPIQGSFSIAVTNSSAVEPDLDNETHILTSLLLKSELKGYIEKPNAYFMDNQVKTLTNLDQLLLTQGWRKIDWKTIAAQQLYVQKFKPETDLKISGNVSTYGGKPISNSKVALFTMSMGIFAIDTLTDIAGDFSFTKLNFPDSTKFVINSLNEKGKTSRGNAKITLNLPARQLVTDNINTGDIEININEQLKNYLKSSDDYFLEQMKRGMLSRTIQLEKVDIIGQKSQKPNSSSLLGAGKADYTFTKKDLLNVSLLSTYITSRTGIPSSQRAPGGMSIGSMTIILDGVVFSGGIDALNPQDIESIEVLKNMSSTSIYGIRGGYGVLVVNSKKGGYDAEDGKNLNPIVYYPKGYATPRQFYSPRYDGTPDAKPDFRNTVYWNPSIVSDAEGKFKLDYFNADVAGIYRVVIEGFDIMGNIARKTFTYQVK